MTTTIYHNPRCGKSRQTLALLEGRGIEPEVIAYLETPPGRHEIETILSLLKLEPRQLMRRKEPEYKALELDNESLTREQLIDALLAHPKLIERPIVIHNGRAAIGRPPETILEIL